MRVFPLLTAVRILITVGTTSANSPTILVATNTQQPVAISVAGPYRQIDEKSLPVLDSEALYSSVFSQQRLQCSIKVQKNLVQRTSLSSGGHRHDSHDA
jgi:hypothetical protein